MCACTDLDRLNALRVKRSSNLHLPPNLKSLPRGVLEAFFKDNMGAKLNAGAVIMISCWVCLIMNDSVLQASGSCYDGDQKVQLTEYWIPRQGSDDVDDDGRVIHLTGPPSKQLVDNRGHVLAKVDRNTAYKCELEGTCLLKDGRLLNTGDREGVFEVVNRDRFPFGSGAKDNPLTPFVSVASNDLPLLSKVFVPILQGRRLPNGKTHNGCVRVDDMLGEHTSCHLDFFLPSYDAYRKLADGLPDNIRAQAHSDCRILHY